MRKGMRLPGLLGVALLFLLASCSTESTFTETTGGPSSAGQPTVAERSPGEAQPEAALVPIAHLSSTAESVSLEELSRIGSLRIPRKLAPAVDELLGEPDVESFESASGVVEYVSRDPGAVGLVPWDAVGPEVKALAVDGEALLEPGGPDGYPLRSEEAEMPDPEELRRIVIGGDVVMDRGMPNEVFDEGRGVDFPMAGGWAAITDRSPPEPNPHADYGVIHQFEAERRGGSGAVREYLSSADLALANLENPVLRDATYHPEGITFNGDLRLLPVIQQAGIDGVTLANNHILDAGYRGLLETTQHLDAAGISHAGAGLDLEGSRKPMTFDLGGVRVGVLSYLGVPGYDREWATPEKPGSAPLEEEVMREDIRELRDEVDLLIVMPHWGDEYTAAPEPGQIRLARAALDEGADLLVGGHAHWLKGMEIYREKPIFYGTGNFLFDQSWSEETSTGIFAEITLHEDRIVQSRPVPFIILDRIQPNFLLPEAGGDRALQIVHASSLGPEFKKYTEPDPQASQAGEAALTEP